MTHFFLDALFKNSWKKLVSHGSLPKNSKVALAVQSSESFDSFWLEFHWKLLKYLNLMYPILFLLCVKSFGSICQNLPPKWLIFHRNNSSNIWLQLEKITQSYIKRMKSSIMRVYRGGVNVEHKKKQAGLYYDSSLSIEKKKKFKLLFLPANDKFSRKKLLNGRVIHRVWLSKSHRDTFINFNQKWISGSYIAISSHKEFKSCLFRLIAHDINSSHVHECMVCLLPSSSSSSSLLHSFTHVHAQHILDGIVKERQRRWLQILISNRFKKQLEVPAKSDSFVFSWVNHPGTTKMWKVFQTKSWVLQSLSLLFFCLSKYLNDVRELLIKEWKKEQKTSTIVSRRAVSSVKSGRSSNTIWVIRQTGLT